MVLGIEADVGTQQMWDVGNLIVCSADGKYTWFAADSGHCFQTSAAEDTNATVAAAQAGAASTGAASVDLRLVGTTPSAAITADAIEQALERPEQFVPLDRRIPKQLVELEQRGWLHIESIEGFVPVRLRDGNTAVVPVQQIDLRLIRNAY